MLDEPSLGPVAAAVQRAVPVAARGARDRRRHPAGRAERAAEPDDRRPRLPDRERPDRRRGHGATACCTDPAVQAAYLGGAAAQGHGRRSAAGAIRLAARLASAGAVGAAAARCRRRCDRSALVRMPRRSGRFIEPAARLPALDPATAADALQRHASTPTLARVADTAARRRRQRPPISGRLRQRGAAPRAASLAAGVARNCIAFAGALRSGAGRQIGPMRSIRPGSRRTAAAGAIGTALGAPADRLRQPGQRPRSSRVRDPDCLTTTVVRAASAPPAGVDAVRGACRRSAASRSRRMASRAVSSAVGDGDPVPRACRHAWRRRRASRSNRQTAVR